MSDCPISHSSRILLRQYKYFFLSFGCTASLVVARRPLNCSMRTLSGGTHEGSSSPTRDRTWAPFIGNAESYPLDHQGGPLLHQFIKNLPQPWCFLPVIFQPLTPTRLLGYKFPLAGAVLRVDPISLAHCEIPLHWYLHLLWWSWIKSACPSLTRVIDYFFCFIAVR